MVLIRAQLGEISEAITQQNGVISLNKRSFAKKNYAVTRKINETAPSQILIFNLV